MINEKQDDMKKEYIRPQLRELPVAIGNILTVSGGPSVGSGTTNDQFAKTTGSTSDWD